MMVIGGMTSMGIITEKNIIILQAQNVDLSPLELVNIIILQAQVEINLHSGQKKV